ncbi:MAG TPA: hypothetical protein VK138_03175 [Acidiferrobacterales bacterium]|nr:hypothetical protein [Acidiferrobacterales bacterium]
MPKGSSVSSCVARVPLAHATAFAMRTVSADKLVSLVVEELLAPRLIWSKGCGRK